MELLAQLLQLCGKNEWGVPSTGGSSYGHGTAFAYSTRPRMVVMVVGASLVPCTLRHGRNALVARYE